MQLHVHLVAAWAPTADLDGQAVVVIDVLRATTTMLAAFEAGATSIIPCAEVDEASNLAASVSPPPLLGGEREGRPIPGFDLGNSPSEYTSERVRGRQLVLTTTNGTRALAAARSARRLVLAAFSNRRAILSALRGEREVHLLCAGTDGYVTEEDALLAGALATGWDELTSDVDCNDAARLCQAAWQRTFDGEPSADALYQVLCRSRGGQNLLALGYDDDIHFASRLDVSTIVPRWQSARGRIEPA